MITPVFDIKQDDHYLFIIIKAPYSKVSEADIFIDGQDFKFFAKPYFLRLHLPNEIVEDERACTVYDAEQGTYNVKVPKEVPGTYFKDLDMLTKLLASSGQRKIVQPMIEVLNSECSETGEEDAEEFDWEFPQTLNKESGAVPSHGYGFANLKKDAFGKLQEDLHNVVQVKNLECSSLSSRMEEMLNFENEQFNPDHYLADYFEDTDVQTIIKLSPPYRAKKVIDEFTDDEKMFLKNLPNKEYLLDKTQLQNAYLGLVDILFSFVYNWRCTQGEYSVESAWNIRTISGLLSWCIEHNTIQGTIKSCCRRSIIFPFYRNWELACVCKKDLVHLLLKGRKYILKCLLKIHDLFSKSDPYYILNDLYITDYCIWIQKANDHSIKSLADSIRHLKLEKNDMDLELIELEQAAKIVLEEEDCLTNTDTLIKQVENLQL